MTSELNTSSSSNRNVVKFGKADKTRPASQPMDEAESFKMPRSRRSAGARNKLVVFLNFVLSGALLAAVIAGIAVYLGVQAFDAPGPLKTKTMVLIEKGAGLNSITDVLMGRGVIDQPLLFKYGIRASRRQAKLKAGEYAFAPEVSMREIVNTIVRGKAIMHAFTAPEGLTSVQIMQRVALNDVLEGDVPSIPAEGAMLPETYNFLRGATREMVVKMMLEHQKTVLAEIWAGRDSGLPVFSPQELVTLASIVEKETGVASERPLVASVFINRLNKGMKLQSDPTIIYGIFGGRGKPKDRPIYRSDINKPTAYNTYSIPALPPGPIANPGRAAMEAVAHPAQSEYLFFVANGTGGHAFAKTLREHEANVIKWRTIERRRAAEAKNAVRGSLEGASESN